MDRSKGRPQAIDKYREELIWSQIVHSKWVTAVNYIQELDSAVSSSLDSLSWIMDVERRCRPHLHVLPAPVVLQPQHCLATHTFLCISVALLLAMAGAWETLWNAPVHDHVQALLRCRAPFLKLDGHTKGVFDNAWSARFKYVASGGSDKHVCVFNPFSGTKQVILQGHNAAVTHVVVNDEDHQVISLSMVRLNRVV